MVCLTAYFTMYFAVFCLSSLIYAQFIFNFLTILDRVSEVGSRSVINIFRSHSMGSRAQPLIESWISLSLSLVLWIVPLAFGWHYLNKWCSRLCRSHAFIFKGEWRVSSIWRQLGTLPAFGQRSVNSKYLVQEYIFYNRLGCNWVAASKNF